MMKNEMKHLDKISLIQKVTVVQLEERPMQFKKQTKREKRKKRNQFVKSNDKTIERTQKMISFLVLVYPSNIHA